MNTDIETAVTAYVYAIQNLNNKWYEEHLRINNANRIYPCLSPQVAVERRLKYFKIVITTGAEDYRKKFAHSFVEITTGRIYRAESWNKAYTRGPCPIKGNVLRLNRVQFDALGVSKERVLV